MLLLEDQNINLSSTGKVYFNYFLDFAKLGEENEQRFLMQVAKYTFEILSREYEVKHEGVLDNYPYELQAFYKKIDLNSFLSIGSIITFVKVLPEKLSEPATGFGKIFRRFSRFIDFCKRNSMNIFMIIIVLATVSYASWQIYMRISLRSATAENTTYIGVERIGEVYLGDEDY